MRFLILESTCDETAAAVVTADLQILGHAVATQDELHERFSGVVPEIAARAHVERILPVIDRALQRASLRIADIEAIAVATSPGLAGSLVIGLVAAKTISWLLRVPLIAIQHIHAHIYACQVAAGRPIFPCVGLVVSGGHTTLFDCQSPTKFMTLGGTIDDAAGEAFDKVANMLGLPYPGGPSLSRIAEAGDRRAHSFPRPFLHETERLQFSFSGLKTAVRYAIAGPGRPDFRAVTLDAQQQANLAASFQEAVVDCLVVKARQALQMTNHRRLCVGGGVAANQRLRQRLQEAAHDENFELLLAPHELCTDNAVMGAIAIEQWRAGQIADLSLDIAPGQLRSH